MALWVWQTPNTEGQNSSRAPTTSTERPPLRSAVAPWLRETIVLHQTASGGRPILFRRLNVVFRSDSWGCHQSSLCEVLIFASKFTLCLTRFFFCFFFFNCECRDELGIDATSDSASSGVLGVVVAAASQLYCCKWWVKGRKTKWYVLVFPLLRPANRGRTTRV